MASRSEELLGWGPAWPFTFGDSDFEGVGGVEAVRQAIRQIIFTRCSFGGMAGELLWDSNRGTALEYLRQSNNGAALSDLARTYVVNAIATQEPRAQVRNARVSRPQANVLQIDLVYDVIIDRRTVAQGVAQRVSITV